MAKLVTAKAWPSGWPLLLIAGPAGVATWTGWVGLGELTGFGAARLFPGVDFEVNTAFTLPLGVEAYAAYSLSVLFSSAGLSSRTRKFAGWSAVISLLLGMTGQVAYHLLSTAGVTSAPALVTTLVACLPVIVLGLVAALRHMVHQDKDNTVEPDGEPETADAVADTPEPAAAQPERPAATGGQADAEPPADQDTDPEPSQPDERAEDQGDQQQGEPETAEARMWAHWKAEIAAGRYPNGAELDRIAGTKDYGRRVLREWAQHGRITATEWDHAKARRGGARDAG